MNKKNIILKRRCNQTGVFQYVVQIDKYGIQLVESKNHAKKFTATEAHLILDLRADLKLKIELTEAQ